MYVSSPANDDSKMGGAYSFDMAAPFANQWGGFASGAYQHNSDGSQWMGNLGLFRQANFSGSTVLDRISFATIFDTLTDTDIDGLFVGQMRLLTGYAFRDSLAMGVIYTQPLIDDDVTIDVSIIGPVQAEFEPSQRVEMFLSGWWGRNNLLASVGYRDAEDTTITSLAWSRPLTEQWTAFTTVDYEAEGDLSGYAGFEFRFGGRPRGSVQRGGIQHPWNDPSLGGVLNYTPAQFLKNISVNAGAGRIASTGGPGNGAFDLEAIGSVEEMLAEFADVGVSETALLAAINNTGPIPSAAPVEVQLGIGQFIADNALNPGPFTSENLFDYLGAAL